MPRVRRAAVTTEGVRPAPLIPTARNSNWIAAQPETSFVQMTYWRMIDEVRRCAAGGRAKLPHATTDSEHRGTRRTPPAPAFPPPWPARSNWLTGYRGLLDCLLHSRCRPVGNRATPTADPVQDKPEHGAC